VTLLGFAGAAFAAVSVLVVHSHRTGADAAGAAGTEPAAAAGGGDTPQAAVTSPIDYIESAEAVERQRFDSRLMSAPSLPDGEMFPLLHVPPLYPPEAAENKIEGYAVGEFTVTPDGDVANVHIVKSSDPAFDQSTVNALQRSKYKPRVVDGRAVAVDGVRVKITYVLQDPDTAQSENEKPPQTPPEPADAPDWREFNDLLAETFDCLKSSDLSCIELNLDRIRMTYTLTTEQRSKLWRIGGFVQHRLGNYERAIEAYERAAALDLQPYSSTWMIVAHIYYERQQYQPALDAALKYLKTARHPNAADYVFVDRLRQLGAVVR
jgi:TonB family protein